MLGKTHLAGGLATAGVICLAASLPLTNGLIAAAGCAVGSLFPDIDHKNSMIGKKVKPISSVISAVAGHRKFFHWFVPYCLAAVVLHFWKPGWDFVTLPILAGILSHLLLDALNPAGIPVFPGLKLHLAKIHTGSRVDLAVGTVLLILAAACFGYWFFCMLRGY